VPVPKRVYELLSQQIIDDYGITEGRCLDVGAGEGQMGLEVARRSDLFVYMLDINAESLARAAVRGNELALLPRIAVIKAAVERMPFIDDYFDIIISRGSIFFWEDKAQGFREIYRVLKPAGVAFVGGGTSRYMPKEEAEEFSAWAREAHQERNPDWGTKSSSENLVRALNESGIPYNLITGYGTWVEIKK
jgi:ubiquinone/menaquinone biosynthesis C-methylase UbiE